MVQVNLRELVGKLNETCRRALESSAGLCLSRSNYNIEIEHWLLKLLEDSRSDLTPILRQFGVETARLSADLTRTIDLLKTGNSRAPALSPEVVSLIREGWLVASIEFGADAARSGHLLCALLGDENLSRRAASASREFDKISLEALHKGFHQLTADSAEAASTAPSSSRAAEAGDRKSPVLTKTPSLDQYTIDLTARARAGHLDPVLGRDPEIRQIVDILTRRRQNNPILTGEAGVGKTAVVEGFALRVAAGEVPEPLRNVAVRVLDLGLLQAGAGVKGEFENRLKSVIEEVKASPIPVILFIDEAHTMIGAGGQAGQGDAANLLKPALARGELRTIAATTWAEYKKYFERDAALARRFQVVKVEEPDEPQAIEMMRGLVATLEGHHRVRILQSALVDAVRLSNRYVSGRQLPDKAVSVLDTTCARIRLSQSSTPPAIEDCRRQIDQYGVLIGLLERESATGADHAEELAGMTERREQAQQRLAELEERWQQEKDLVQRIGGLRSRLEQSLEADKAKPAENAGAGDADASKQSKAKEKPAPDKTASEKTPPEKTPVLNEQQRAELRKELKSVEAQLRELQGENPLVHFCVDSQSVAETISAWTGIPLGRMVADEVKTVLNLKQLMEDSIIGQSHALDTIAQSVRTSRANLADPRTPKGVFLLAGTSGVGKTETAITLANLLYGGEQNMTVINMSEFKEEHKVSLLMGSPPGYVGYGEGGVLTEAVRRKPYSVVLLDEMEKAHSGVQDIFYQVFDKGTMKDGEGRDIDFKNTIILMTTNAGGEVIKRMFGRGAEPPSPEALNEALFAALLKTFKPAFLGRLMVVPYYPLADDTMKRIIKLKLGKIASRVRENYRAGFEYTPELVETIASRCTEVETGARNVDHILTRTLLPELSAEFLARMTENQPIGRVQVSVGDEGRFHYAID